VARPVLTGPVSRSTVPSPETPRAPAVAVITGAKLQLRLRQARSTRYSAALSRLDAGIHHQDRAALDEVVAAISAEFPDLTIEQRPIGLLSKCYLGPPYEVHICDLAGLILEHFETFRQMPPLYERARQLARHKQYAFIEIYSNHVCAVLPDGSVALIEV
jgi:hypothetical protein